jgi:FG-GAP-like repeat
MRAKDRLLVAAAAALVLVVSASAGGGAGGVPSFVPGPSFDAGYAPAEAVVADFNRDQKPDLAVANCIDTYDYGGEEEIGSEVVILLGDGHGGARPGAPPPLPADVWTCALASADFNGDGSADLAVVDSVAKTVAVLLSDGTGHFAPAGGSPIHLDGAPATVVAADVNGDARPDLVVPVADSSGHGIEILLDDGSGGFVQAPGSPVPILAGNTISVAVANLDGDGHVDLAVANTERNEISIMRGDGAGGFAPAATVGSGRHPSEIAVGDFDGNGKPDLATLVTNGVEILLGDATGNFTAPAGSPVPVHGDHLAVGDLNGDARSDFVTSHAYGNGVSVEVATGGGAFKRATFSPFGADFPSLLGIADFDGDGRPDIASSDAVLLQTESSPQARAGRVAAGRDSVFATRKGIVAFAAEGSHAAVCAGYGVLVAWTPGRGFVTFKGSCSDVAVGAGHIAWIEEPFCGNTEGCMDVFAAKLSGGRRKRLNEVVNDCGAGPCDPGGTWVENLLGGGPLIAWDDSTVECTRNCEEGQDFEAQWSVKSQQLRRFYRGRGASVRHGSTDHPLLAVGGSRMALQAGGRIIVLKQSGARIASVSAPDAQSAALSRTELAVAGRSALSLYNAATGHLRKMIALGPNAALQLAGVTSRLAVLRGPHSLVLVRLRDGALVFFPLSAKAAQGLVDAQLTTAGLFYAYNAGGKGGRVVFERTARLLARLR